MKIILGFGDHITSTTERNMCQAMSTLLIMVTVYLATWMLSFVLFIVLNAIGINHCFSRSKLIAIIDNPELQIISSAYSVIVLELNFVINFPLQLWRSKDYRQAMLRVTKTHENWVTPVIKITNSNGDEQVYCSQ